MKKDREKELKYLLYLKGQLIKETKKEIKKIREELSQINDKGDKHGNTKKISKR